MEIVVTNDDGWGSKGIITLVEQIRELGHVTVVAPDSARSGHGACISVTKELRIQKIESKWENVEIYTTNGTPADCVKLALEVIREGEKVDLLVSGINHGSNASVNIVYSGTMGACFVGAEHGVPAIGFSLDDYDKEADFSQLIPYILPIIKERLAAGFERNECANVNAPKGEIKGYKLCRQCKGHWEKEYESHIDENGETYYTMTGQYVNEEPEAEDTDNWAMAHGMISIQPVSIDLTKRG